MTFCVPIPELDELIQFGVSYGFHLNHDSKTAHYLEYFVGLCRKGLVTFDTQKITILSIPIQLLSVEDRSIFFSVETKFLSIVNKLCANKGFRIQGSTSPQKKTILDKIKYKFSTQKYILSYDLNSIDSVKEKMDQLKLSLKKIVITQDLIQIELGIKTV